MDTMEYPAAKPIPKNGNETLFNNGVDISKLSDFWSWAYSDINGNTVRGKFAEYLVALSLGIEHYISNSWDQYDLLYQNTVKIEVKTSGYLQSWGQKKLSQIIFGIQPTLGWDASTNTYATTRKRQSDIYVFCVETCTNQSELNPLDLSQWEFYIIKTDILNQRDKERKHIAKTITLGVLKQMGIKAVAFSKIKEAIHQTIK